MTQSPLEPEYPDADLSSDEPDSEAPQSEAFASEGEQPLSQDSGAPQPLFSEVAHMQAAEFSMQQRLSELQNQLQKVIQNADRAEPESVSDTKPNPDELA
ncbi:MAG: hypothetical protein CVV27_09910 [Candidatus Melainabacteria bacterium HGW-Melainabacteria-1]|nr:MAG: hypothetical protein CVV27_09910 [Candidatus Melainabacteria bacterium HGW-Melainabacteria-1]